MVFEHSEQDDKNQLVTTFFKWLQSNGRVLGRVFNHLEWERNRYEVVTTLMKMAALLFPKARKISIY